MAKKSLITRTLKWLVIGSGTLVVSIIILEILFWICEVIAKMFGMVIPATDWQTLALWMLFVAIPVWLIWYLFVRKYWPKI